MQSSKPGASMRRREFIGGVAGCGTLWPVAGLSQTMAKRPLIGLLTPSSKEIGRGFFEEFFKGMRELGYLEKRDYGVEERFGEGNLEHLQQLADELVSLRPDLMVVGASTATIAVKKITSTIPIVGVSLIDPVREGLAETETRPGRNVTGTLIRLQGMTEKQLEIGLELTPGTTKVGAMVNPATASFRVQEKELQTAATKLGVSLVVVQSRIADNIISAFQEFAREGVKIVVVVTDPVFLAARRKITALALANRMATIFYQREYVDVGGLASYGVNLNANYRRAAYYVDKIFKGEKPAELPFEFPARVELVINLATAAAIGLTIPPALLARADDVIE
jgi:putative ABC transport system substrate-binding protein